MGGWVGGCVRACVRVWGVGVRVCACVHMNTHAHTYIHACIHTYRNIYMYAHTYILSVYLPPPSKNVHSGAEAAMHLPSAKRMQPCAGHAGECVCVALDGSGGRPQRRGTQTATALPPRPPAATRPPPRRRARRAAAGSASEQQVRMRACAHAHLRRLLALVHRQAQPLLKLLLLPP